MKTTTSKPGTSVTNIVFSDGSSKDLDNEFLVRHRAYVPVPIEPTKTEPTDEDFAKHVEEHLGVHYDDAGKPAGVVFEGEVFTLQELGIEEDLAEIQQETTSGVVRGELDPFERLIEYIEETGHEQVTRDMLTPSGVPYVAWDANAMPVIGGDEELHERLGLPDDVIAAMSSNGVVHTMFNPFLHGIPTEGIGHD